VKSEANWQAIGSLAGVASAIIAFLAYTSHAQGTGSPPAPSTSADNVSPSTTVAQSSPPNPWSSLPNPCEAPVAETINSSLRSDPTLPKSNECTWVDGEIPHHDIFILTYYPTRPGPDPGSSSISLPGRSNATEKPSGHGGCQIWWNTSFGSITVTASSGRNEQGDSCVDVRNWVVSLLPSLPT